MRSNFSSPSSRLMELMMLLPWQYVSASSTRVRIGGVDHHRRLDLADQLFVERRMSFISSRSVDCRQTSTTCAPFFTCQRAISVASSHFSPRPVLEQARADHVGALADDQRTVLVVGFDQFDAAE
jgi:hypothetical protein